MLMELRGQVDAFVAIISSGGYGNARQAAELLMTFVTPAASLRPVFAIP